MENLSLDFGNDSSIYEVWGYDPDEYNTEWEFQEHCRKIAMANGHKNKVPSMTRAHFKTYNAPVLCFTNCKTRGQAEIRAREAIDEGFFDVEIRQVGASSAAHGWRRESFYREDNFA